MNLYDRYVNETQFVDSKLSGWAGPTSPWKLECESTTSRSSIHTMITQARHTTTRTEKAPLRVFPWLISAVCLLTVLLAFLCPSKTGRIFSYTMLPFNAVFALALMIECSIKMADLNANVAQLEKYRIINGCTDVSVGAGKIKAVEGDRSYLWMLIWSSIFVMVAGVAGYVVMLRIELALEAENRCDNDFTAVDKQVDETDGETTPNPDQVGIAAVDNTPTGESIKKN